MPTQLIVTHRGNLKKKYGAGLAAIDTAVKQLVTADAARGITDKLIYLDGPAMGKARARGVNPKSFKQAIDHAWLRHRQPDYILILGGPDIVPHQPLANPIGGEDAKDDPVIPSDLPYACTAPYGTAISDFIGPSRVVGRLPDLPGHAEPGLLVDLLANAATWKPKARASKRVFALSAYKWRRSTHKSVAALFGSTVESHLSPKQRPPWPTRLMQPEWHFINCHGAKVDTHFYGEKRGRFPIAHHAPDLTGKITRGTVAAAECCYGAQLYDPSRARGRGIGVSYLAEGAIGYVGSTTVAYGPSTVNASADLICRFFVEKARQGWSLGSAFLEARLMFARASAPLSPIDLKTIAQFILLAGPSLRAVSGDKVVGKAFKAHGQRRMALAAQATLLTNGADTAVPSSRGTSSPDIRRTLLAAADADDYRAVEPPRTFNVKTAVDRSARSMVAPFAADSVKFHVLMAEPRKPAPRTTARALGIAAPEPAISTRMIVLGREVNGQLVSVERLYAKG